MIRSRLLDVTRSGQRPNPSFCPSGTFPFLPSLSGFFHSLCQYDLTVSANGCILECQAEKRPRKHIIIISCQRHTSEAASKEIYFLLSGSTVRQSLVDLWFESLPATAPRSHPIYQKRDRPPRSSLWKQGRFARIVSFTNPARVW
jgi:hypothetical protein